MHKYIYNHERQLPYSLAGVLTIKDVLALSLLSRKKKRGLCKSINNWKSENYVDLRHLLVRGANKNRRVKRLTFQIPQACEHQDSARDRNRFRKFLHGRILVGYGGR
jgi:hypothetical protein